MSTEQDRPAMQSDLLILERKLRTDLEDLKLQIREEGTTTRRHFDVVAEQMRDSVKLVAEVAAHHSTVLDDHENRLREIENR